MKKVESLRQVLLAERAELDGIFDKYEGKYAISKSIKAEKERLNHNIQLLEKSVSVLEYHIAKSENGPEVNTSYTKRGEELKEEIEKAKDDRLFYVSMRLRGFAIANEIKKYGLEKELIEETIYTHEKPTDQHTIKLLKADLLLSQSNLLEDKQRLKELNNDLKRLKKLDQSHCKSIIAYNKLLKSKNMFDIEDSIAYKAASEFNQLYSITTKRHSTYSIPLDRHAFYLGRAFGVGNSLLAKLSAKLDLAIQAETTNPGKGVSAFYSVDGFKAFMRIEKKRDQEYKLALNNPDIVNGFSKDNFARDMDAYLDQKVGVYKPVQADKQLSMS